MSRLHTSTGGGQSPRGDVGYTVPAGWGATWKSKRAATATGLATIAVMGDSVSRGYYASNLTTKGWAGLLRATLQGQYGDGGSGFKGTADTGVFATARGIPAAARTAYAATDYLTLAGTWVEYQATGNAGPGAYAIRTQTAGSTATFTVRGTRVDFYTLSNGGGNANWTYTVDGGGAVAVTDGAGFAVQRTTVTGLSDGTHTIVVTYNGDGVKYLYLTGVEARRGAGVLVNNYSQYGGVAANFGNSSLKDASYCGGYSNPADLVIVSFGLNEAGANVTGDTYAKNMRRVLDQLRDGDTDTTAGARDLLFLIQHPGKYDRTNYVYQDYAERLTSLAGVYGAAVVNMWALGRNSWRRWSDLGYWSAADGAGTAGTDSVHPSDAGHQHIANTLLPLL